MFAILFFFFLCFFRLWEVSADAGKVVVLLDSTSLLGVTASGAGCRLSSWSFALAWVLVHLASSILRASACLAASSRPRFSSQISSLSFSLVEISSFTSPMMVRTFLLISVSSMLLTSSSALSTVSSMRWACLSALRSLFAATRDSSIRAHSSPSLRVSSARVLLCVWAIRRFRSRSDTTSLHRETSRATRSAWPETASSLSSISLSDSSRRWRRVASLSAFLPVAVAIPWEVSLDSLRSEASDEAFSLVSCCSAASRLRQALLVAEKFRW
mmetsp:Transcript_4656/g.16308  ORF Transcript_4656/g.16308 Transcript_4656/m.16308 type:complete len:271 (-) Transcript_4656:548-1360(-)